MKFILQNPAHIPGSYVKYDDITKSLHTVNGIQGEESFYQTFGDLVLNFDITGRLLSVDGRLNIGDGVASSNSGWNDQQCYLVTGVLEMSSIKDRTESKVEQGVLTVWDAGKEPSNYGVILDNARVGLTEGGELASIEVALR